MHFKKTAAVLALLCILGTTSLPLQAKSSMEPKTIGQISPRMSYISQSESILDIVGSKAYVSVYVERTLEGGKIVITSKLQCDGKTVKTWTKTENSNYYGEIGETYTISKHGTYQIVTSYTVYSADGRYSEYMVDKSNTVVY